MRLKIRQQQLGRWQHRIVSKTSLRLTHGTHNSSAITESRIVSKTGLWLMHGTQNSSATTRSLVIQNHQRNWFTADAWDLEFVSDDWVAADPEFINATKFHSWRMKLSANTIYCWLKNHQRELSHCQPRICQQIYVVANFWIGSDDWAIFGFTLFLGST